MIFHNKKMIDDFIDMANRGGNLKTMYVYIDDNFDFEDREQLIKDGFVIEVDPIYILIHDNYTNNIKSQKNRKFVLTDAGIELVIFKAAL